MNINVVNITRYLRAKKERNREKLKNGASELFLDFKLRWIAFPMKKSYQ